MLNIGFYFNQRMRVGLCVSLWTHRTTKRFFFNFNLMFIKHFLTNLASSFCFAPSSVYFLLTDMIIVTKYAAPRDKTVTTICNGVNGILGCRSPYPAHFGNILDAQPGQHIRRGCSFLAFVNSSS